MSEFTRRQFLATTAAATTAAAGGFMDGPAFNVAHTETFAKLNAGVLSPQQDVIHIQQPFVRPLAQRKWILPLEMSKLKNHGRMFDQFKNPEWIQHEGKPYGVPYYWGYDSIVYNAKQMPDGGETWG